MPVKTVFICGLHNLEVDSDLGDGLNLIPNEKNPELPNIKITNNKKKIKYLLSKQFLPFIGAIEYNHLDGRYPLVAYAESEFDSANTNSIQHLDLHLFVLKMYLFCLWLAKDHAGDFDIGYLQFVNETGVPEVSANSMTSTNFNASGKRDPTRFTVEELEKGIRFLKDSIQIEHENRPKLAIASSLDRVSIALYFIQSAMAASDLGIKAVGFCSALETLFSNGENTELSHKLAERISKFLETDLEQRKMLFKAVKKIYEIRSKVVHGATFKVQKTEELSCLVKDADEICRRVMIYTLTTPEDESIFDKSREDLDAFFIDLILK